MRKYIKPEVLSRNSIKVNESIARCQIEWNWRVQNQYTDHGPTSIDDENYGYPSLQAAVDIRFSPKDGSAFTSYDGGYFSPVGPIHKVIIDGSHYYYWEDFNNNRRFDYNYGWYADNFISNDVTFYGLVSADNLNANAMVTVSDNLQGVGGNVDPSSSTFAEEFIGPKTGMIIQS